MSNSDDNLGLLWPYPNDDSSKITGLLRAICFLCRWYSSQGVGVDSLTNLNHKDEFIRVCKRLQYQCFLSDACADFCNIQQVLLALRKMGALPPANSTQEKAGVQKWWTEQTPEENRECIIRE